MRISPKSTENPSVQEKRTAEEEKQKSAKKKKAKMVDGQCVSRNPRSSTDQSSHRSRKTKPSPQHPPRKHFGEQNKWSKARKKEKKTQIPSACDPATAPRKRAPEIFAEEDERRAIKGESYRFELAQLTEQARGVADLKPLTASQSRAERAMDLPRPR
ncbi:hypothetical protein EUGRSUZ_A02385 [Eucalyptus grandis]|uniref:Uncharacterized protein n=2 Tax=Eucalyptus grandis TaxID=71139 RepID=A0ACC3M5W3_EUCGR|nr:hypothetical protein EUGRSUZ_A02385 [Eucalyptus grandis]